VLRAVVDDALRGFRAYARKKRELRDVGGVDVDDARRRAGRSLGGECRADGDKEKCCNEKGEGLPHGVFFLSVSCCLLVVRSIGCFGSSTRGPSISILNSAQETLSFGTTSFSQAVHSSIGPPRGIRSEVVGEIGVRREARLARCQKSW